MLPSGLPDQVADEESLARFLTQSNQFNRLIAKPAAFLPSSGDRETSASRHGLEPRRILWEIGRAAAGTRRLYGAAILSARQVREALLQVLADEPPARHAVIVGWPWCENDPELQKARQKERAILLAQAAGEPVLCDPL
jgi:hypothetical protein